METVIKIAELGRNARQQKNIKLRQPLQRTVVITDKEEHLEAVEMFEDILMDELNVKELDTAEDESEFTETQVAPNFSSLGPKFKGDAQKVGDAIEEADPVKVKEELSDKGFTEIDGFKIEEEDVEISENDKEGYASSGGEKLKVYTDVKIDEQLEKEGIARDVVRRIQTMRKDLELGYTQNIDTFYRGNLKIQEAISDMKGYIKKETLSKTLEKGVGGGYKKEWEIDGKELTLWVEAIMSEE